MVVLFCADDGGVGARPSREKTTTTVRVAHRAVNTLYRPSAGDTQRAAVADADVALPRRPDADRLTLLPKVYAGGAGQARRVGAPVPVAPLTFDGRVTDVVGAARFAALRVGAAVVGSAAQVPLPALRQSLRAFDRFAARGRRVKSPTDLGELG